MFTSNYSQYTSIDCKKMTGLSKFALYKLFVQLFYYQNTNEQPGHFVGKGIRSSGI